MNEMICPHCQRPGSPLDRPVEREEFKKPQLVKIDWLPGIILSCLSALFFLVYSWLEYHENLSGIAAFIYTNRVPLCLANIAIIFATKLAAEKIEKDEFQKRTARYSELRYCCDCRILFDNRQNVREFKEGSTQEFEEMMCF